MTSVDYGTVGVNCHQLEVIKKRNSTIMIFRLATAAALVAGASSFSPGSYEQPFSTALSDEPTMGAGGMADTRDPNELEHDDPRKSISAAPSFEDYLKIRQGGAGDASTSPAPAAPTPVAAAPVAAAVSTGGAGDAVATMEASQANSIAKIASAITDLASKPDFTWTPADGVIVQGCVATVDARDAPGPANIAWFAGVCVESKMSSLTIFNGPLTNIPHLVSRCTVVGDQLQLKLDFRPRCYGAYEMRRDDGTYPGPEEFGRKSFEYSGARKEFDTKFGNNEVQEFIKSSLASFDGATDYDPNPSEFDLLTRGPLFTSVTMPNTDANVAAVVAAREKAADFLLSWAMDDQHEHRPGAPVNTQYVYDTKFKQNAYGALLGEYQEIYGTEDGQKLAVGESGPLDEGYVGGGS
jgi:hypothetical protein